MCIKIMFSSLLRHILFAIRKEDTNFSKYHTAPAALAPRDLTADFVPET